mmetsp:Transcript_23623/g.41910  ORF Transcript_23623/g.41910 Transcript_23623/m.41910 type:complete len:238 (+) Transcript_23623:5033-5746(+)
MRGIIVALQDFGTIRRYCNIKTADTEFGKHIMRIHRDLQRLLPMGQLCAHKWRARHRMRVQHFRRRACAAQTGFDRAVIQIKGRQQAALLPEVIRHRRRGRHFPHRIGGRGSGAVIGRQNAHASDRWPCNPGHIGMRVKRRLKEEPTGITRHHLSREVRDGLRVSVGKAQEVTLAPVNPHGPFGQRSEIRFAKDRVVRVTRQKSDQSLRITHHRDLTGGQVPTRHRLGPRRANTQLL